MLSVEVRATKHAADQTYAVVTFRKWYDGTVRRCIEKGGIQHINNFHGGTERIVMHKIERDFGATGADKKVAASKTMTAEKKSITLAKGRPDWVKTKHNSLSGSRLYLDNCGKCEKTCFVPFMPVTMRPVPLCSQCMIEEGDTR